MKTSTKKTIVLDDSLSCHSDTQELSIDEDICGKIQILVQKTSFLSLRNNENYLGSPGSGQLGPLLHILHCSFHLDGSLSLE